MRFRKPVIIFLVLLTSFILNAEADNGKFLPDAEKFSVSNIFLEAGSGFCSPMRFFNQGTVAMTNNGYHFLTGVGYDLSGWLFALAISHDRWGQSLRQQGLMEKFTLNVIEARVRKVISDEIFHFLPFWLEIVPGFGLGANFITTDYYPSLRAKEEGKLKSVNIGDSGSVCFFYRISLELAFPLNTDMLIPFIGWDYNAFYDVSIGGGFAGYSSIYLGLRCYPMAFKTDISRLIKQQNLKKTAKEIEQWPEPEALLKVHPDNDFTPDGDGLDDEAVIIPSSRYLQYPPERWNVRIFDQQNHLFREWNGNGRLPSVIVWNGLSDFGEHAFSKNTYKVKFTITPDERDIERTGKTELYAEDSIETGILFQEIIPGKQWKVIVNTIYFDPDKATFNRISAAQRKSNNDTLDILSLQIKSRGSVKVLVQGYANNVSNTEWENVNELIPLSRLRANTIMNLLVKRGIDSEILSYEGLGGANPIAAWEDRESWWKNRRVEFIVTKIEE